MSTRREFIAQTGAILASRDVAVSESVGHERPVTHSALTTCKIPQTDLVVSRIAFGGGGFGSGAEAARMINTVYDHGITFFDLADVYQEEPFGDALRSSPSFRDKIVIQSKCGIVIEGTPPDQSVYLDFSRDHIVSAAEGSLRRLRTDHLDILLLHWPDALVEPEEVARAFDDLRRSGKVRYFGVSNHTPSQIERLKGYVRQPLVVNQIYLSLENSYLLVGGVTTLWDNSRNPYNYTAAAPTLEYCLMHGIQVQAWAPLRGSLLNPGDSATPELKRGAQVLADMAKKKNTTPSALALAWLLRHPAKIVPIIFSTNPAHVVEDCAADRITLSRSEWYTLLAATFEIESRRPL